MNTDQTATQQVLVEYANENLNLKLQVAQLRAELEAATAPAEGGEDGATGQEA